MPSLQAKRLKKIAARQPLRRTQEQLHASPAADGARSKHLKKIAVRQQRRRTQEQLHASPAADGSRSEASETIGTPHHRLPSAQKLESIVELLRHITKESMKGMPSITEMYPDGIPDEAGVKRGMNLLRNWFQPRRTNYDSSAEWFWDRFDFLRKRRDVPPLSPSIRELITTPSIKLLFTDGQLDNLLRADIHTEGPMQLLRAMGIMQNVEDRSAKLNLICIIMHIYFFITWDPDWARKKSQYNRIRHYKDDMEEQLNRAMYNDYTELVREHDEDAECMEYEVFQDKVKTWVKSGSKYVFLASNLSLGSLVLLQDKLNPTAMNLCTKGNEKAQSLDGTKLSEEVLDRLRQCGVVQAAADADKMMHTLLCNLMGLENVRRFPGFD